ncbi:MAG: hypothetical protein IPM56_11200 [Ignavibacteriales bacterium]|nr:MAG: hypothetical protein IPM56_11200 [Ignavibacteriales bacterium]
MKLLAIFLFTSTLVFSQGEHVWNDGIGIGLGYHYGYAENFSGNGFNIGLSILGIADLAYSNMSGTNSTTSAGDKKSSSSTYHLGLNLKTTGTNTKLIIGYATASLRPTYDRGSNASGMIFGLKFNFKAFDDKYVFLMPGIGFTYGSLSNSGNSGAREKEKSVDLWSFGIEFNIDIQPSDSFKFIISPALSKELLHNVSPVTIGISFGLLLNPRLETQEYE